VISGQVKPLNQRQQAVAMKIEMVHNRIDRLVRAPEAEKIRRDNAPPGSG
jgi:hypothetical protein